MLAALVAAALAGCAPDSSENEKLLQAEISRLEWDLKLQSGERAAELEYLSREAGIAAGCDWAIPLCPDSVTDVGRRAQADGIGSGSRWFWFAVFAKLLALAFAILAVVTPLALVWHRLMLPAKSEIEAARHLIAEAENDAQRAQQSASDASEETQRLQNEIEAAQVELTQLYQEVDRVRDEVAETHQELQAAQSVQSALDVF